MLKKSMHERAGGISITSYFYYVYYFTALGYFSFTRSLTDCLSTKSTARSSFSFSMSGCSIILKASEDTDGNAYLMYTFDKPEANYSQAIVKLDPANFTRVLTPAEGGIMAEFTGGTWPVQLGIVLYVINMLDYLILKRLMDSVSFFAAVPSSFA